MYGTKYFDENFLGKSQIMGNHTIDVLEYCTVHAGRRARAHAAHARGRGEAPAVRRPHWHAGATTLYWSGHARCNEVPVPERDGTHHREDRDVALARPSGEMNAS
jgi:hypothetical protein